jgi:hypothetical protein
MEGEEPIEDDENLPEREKNSNDSGSDESKDGEKKKKGGKNQV